MADKKSSSKREENPVTPNAVTEKADKPDAAAETPETALTAPAPDSHEYLRVFQSAQEVCVSKLQALANASDDEDSVGIAKLIRSARPVTKGREEMVNDWNIPVIRIVYGTTKDPARPVAARPGDMYATNGRIIEQGLLFTPLYIFESNRMFQEGNNAPLCWSPDAVVGTMFGACATCVNQPMGKNATGERTDCSNGVCMVALSRDWKLYRLEFFKTSRKAGTSVDRLVRGQDMLWERWYELRTQQVTSNGYEYYVFKTAPAGHDVNNAGVQASDALYDLVKTERDAFLKKFYTQTLQNADNTSGTSTDESVDENALMGGSANTNPTDLSSGDL